MSDVVTATPEEPVLDVLPRPEMSPVRRALVLDEGRLIGILTVGGVTRALAWPSGPAKPAPHTSAPHLTKEAS
ncbi:CBS domain-containing protein [Streptomyces barringtoniae]|uniref:CBS domain-containing protein n=1 Tax=Streptomyces barringtoniae TaxID=2892029 RepID=UPI001E3419B9|nr:CBS domain-containing protein [Streptomyces barringtoniae]MCC5481159.1 CBS domain-containing protein [Streptomyces barringtoniae]